jgi:hypothetical protein
MEELMATQYDPEVLQKYAHDLYKQAKVIVFITAIRYGALSFVLFYLLFGLLSAIPHLLPRIPLDSVNLILGIIVFLSVCLGINAGRRKSFNFKLQAQQILCQQQIEVNTRIKASGASGS